MSVFNVFLMPTNIGDFVLATPVLRYIEQTDPETPWLMVAGKAAMPLISTHPLVCKAYPVERFRGVRGKLQLYRFLSRKKIGVLVDLRKTAFPYLLKAEKRFFRLRSLSGHAFHDYCSVLSGTDMNRIPQFLIHTQEQDSIEARTILQEQGIINARLLIGLNPDANWEKKRWPPRNWEKLILLIKERYPEAVFVVVGLSRHLPGNLPDTHDLSGRLSLRALAELLKRCRLFISNDSGPMHLSVAVGTRTLGIFGPSHPERYAPFGAEHEYYKNTALCPVCKTTECDRDFWCLKNTFPEVIAELASSML